MMRTIVILSCTLMVGCNSCLEDKKVPEAQHEKANVRLVRTDAGVRAIDLNEGPRLSGLAHLMDGGRDAGSN